MNINLQMLEEELVEAGVTGETLELLRSSREEVLRLERLVKDFLAYARPQPSAREELSPVELVGDVVRFLRPQFDDRGVRLELRNEEGVPTVRIDPGQVRQAVEHEHGQHAALHQVQRPQRHPPLRLVEAVLQAQAGDRHRRSHGHDDIEACQEPPAELKGAG